MTVTKKDNIEHIRKAVTDALDQLSALRDSSDFNELLNTVMHLKGAQAEFDAFVGHYALAFNNKTRMKHLLSEEK